MYKSKYSGAQIEALLEASDPARIDLLEQVTSAALTDLDSRLTTYGSVTSAALADLDARLRDIPKPDLSQYVTRTDLAQALAGYATTGEVADAVKDKADRSEIPSIAGLARESWVSGNYQPIGNYLTSIPDEYVTDTELAAKGYATETYVQGLIGDINSALAAIIALQ